MKLLDIQRLLAAANYYRGGLDGDWGPLTAKAVDRVLEGRKESLPQGFDAWTHNRKAIAAAQLILKHGGYEPGLIDGYVGHNTIEAYRAWDFHRLNGKKEVIERVPQRANHPVTRFPYQSQCKAFYGDPAQGEVKPQLVMIDLPFQLRLDWALDQRVNRISIHKKCAEATVAAFEDIEKAYNETQRRELGIDRFAGSYNHRAMRGGTSWSMHAYGAALDFFAAPNGLRAKCPKALFCKDDYVTFFDIWESYGFISLGREIGRDWMHVQAARLD